jgi:hypothetical protein
MKIRLLLAAFASFLCLLVTPHVSSADPTPTTRPASQNSNGGQHRNNNGFGGGPGRGQGGGPGRGPGGGDGMGPMQRGFGGGPRGGQFMQHRGPMWGQMGGGMQNRGQARSEEGGVDQQTIAKLESQVEKLSAQLDRMQKQLDERDGGRADRGRYGYQKSQMKGGKDHGFARQQKNGRGANPSFRGMRRFEQQRSEQFAPHRGGPRGFMQPHQQNNRGGYGQSFDRGWLNGFGPMSGGPRCKRPPAFMQRFAPSYGGGFQQNRGFQYQRGEQFARGGNGRKNRGMANEGDWRSRRDEQQFNGYRQPPHMNQQQRWNGPGDDGYRGSDRMSDGPGPRDRQDDRGWNGNGDGRSAPDFDGPHGFQQHRHQNQGEDDSQQGGGPRYRDGGLQQR